MVQTAKEDDGLTLSVVCFAGWSHSSTRCAWSALFRDEAADPAAVNAAAFASANAAAAAAAANAADFEDTPDEAIAELDANRLAAPSRRTETPQVQAAVPSGTVTKSEPEFKGMWPMDEELPVQPDSNLI